ncbi:hypothetical protein [Glutamicibacter sp. PS]|uniref:hypothetical protein n=1 Tax=Glutamicibacter sp. PS TaxID=3075634 RepID=UPI0028445FE4|nr:hypothetical protein [Glutamicibacter sp. PS]MDR4532852.1 hypothetical protein [Glutamicibacter sp. PS]
MHSATGGRLFRISYSGTIWRDVIVGEQSPALVLTHAIDTGETLTIFDEGGHGYDTMFVDIFDPGVLDSRTARHPLVIDAEDCFEIELELFDNVDWDEEEQSLLDQQGELRLQSGELIDSARLRADGFDAIGITVISRDGTRHEIVSEELG